MAFDNFKRVLYNDGEILTEGDLNDSQNFAQSVLFDQIVGKCLPGDSSLGASVDPEFSSQFSQAHNYWAIALSATSGAPTQGSAGNKIKMTPGTVFQVIGSDTGNESVVLAYTFAGSADLAGVTIGNGNGVNPRVDLLQMKLEYAVDDLQTRSIEDAVTDVIAPDIISKKRRVKATISLKAGTPAATPQFPDADAGYCALGAVFTYQSFTGSNALGRGALDDVLTGVFPAINGAALFDLRMPVNVRPYTVRAKDGLFNPAVWIPQHAAISSPGPTQARSLKCNTNTTGTATSLIILLPQTKGRLVGVAVASLNGPASANHTLLMTLAEPDGFGMDLDITAVMETGATMKYKLAGLNVIETSEFGARSAVQGLGKPVWCDGGGRLRETFKTYSGNAPYFQSIAVFFQASTNCEVAVVTFYIAEGW